MKRTTTYASRALISALILGAASASALAQQQPDAAPAQPQDPEAKTEAPVFKPSVPKVSGLINVRYTYNSDDATPNSFDIRRLRLAVSGDISPKIDYKFQAEYETSVKVIDAFVRFKPAKAFNVQVGEFKVAYSQETQDGPAKWITIENPSVVGKLNGYSDISGLKANGRDVGVRFYGSTGAREGFDIFTYRVGVYNGNGINVKDADEHKDVSLYAAFSPVKALTISAAQYFGKYAGAKRDRTSAGVTLKQGGLYVRSEYLHGQTGDVKHQGVYVTAAY